MGDFEYVSNEKGNASALAKDGIEGLFYRKFDETMLMLYCTRLNGVTLAAIRAAWKGVPWNNIGAERKSDAAFAGHERHHTARPVHVRLNKDHQILIR